MRPGKSSIFFAVFFSAIVSVIYIGAAQAYISPYMVKVEPDGRLATTDRHEVSQGQQILKKGDVTYFADTGTRSLIKTQNGSSNVVVGRTAHNQYHPAAEGSIAIDADIMPAGFDVDSNGVIYVADPYAHKVFKIGADGLVHTVAGSGETGAVEDAADATQTPFNSPTFVKSGPDGLLYVSDENVVRRINADGSTTRIAGAVGQYRGGIVEGGKALEQTLPGPTLLNKINPVVIDFDTAGRLYIGSKVSVLRLDNDGRIYTVAKSNPIAAGFTRDEQPLASKVFPSEFTGFDVGPNDDLWLSMANYNGSNPPDPNGTVFRIHDNIVTTVAGGGSIGRNLLPDYGNNLLADFYAAPFADSSGVYFQAGAQAGVTLHGSSHNSTFPQDQVKPEHTGSAFSVDPKLVNGSTVFSAGFRDPGNGSQTSGVARVEYFVDGTDPGRGKATSMPYTGAAFTSIFGSNSLPVGQHTVFYRAVDKAGNWTQVFSRSLMVVGPPEFTSTDSLDASLRKPFSFTVTTSGGVPAPTTITEEGEIPMGVTFTDNADGTATIAGQPAIGSTGIYSLTLTAENGSGVSAVQELTLSVNPGTEAPAFISETNLTVPYDVSFSFTVNTSGYPIPKISGSGNLPPGVRLVNNGDGTATISGTAGKAAVGDYHLDLNAKSSAGSDSQDFTLTISRTPVFQAAPKSQFGAVGKPLSFNVRASGFLAPKLSASSLPSGLALTSNADGTAVISGIPAADSAGSTVVTIYASSQDGVASKDITFNIKGAPTAFMSPAKITALPGEDMSFQVAATGFPQPKFAVIGALPPGVTFDSITGSFLGSPKFGTEGSYPLIIKTNNGSGAATQNLTLIIGATRVE